MPCHAKTVTSLITHELVLCFLFCLQMISTKFYAGHDERFYLEDWAKEGNMSEDKLKQMELEFLTAIVNTSAQILSIIRLTYKFHLIGLEHIHIERAIL